MLGWKRGHVRREVWHIGAEGVDMFVGRMRHAYVGEEELNMLVWRRVHSAGEDRDKNTYALSCISGACV